MDYTESPEAEAIAKDIIANLPLVSAINEAKIKYLFTLKKHSDFAGRIQKPGRVWKFLSDYDYIVLIHKETWDAFNETQRRALIYHELNHITYRIDKEGNKQWKLRKHDIEEFLDVVREFGAWTTELNQLKEITDETSTQSGLSGSERT